MNSFSVDTDEGRAAIFVAVAVLLFVAWLAKLISEDL